MSRRRRFVLRHVKTQTCTITWPDSVSFVDVSLSCEAEEWLVGLQFDGVLIEGAGLTPQDAVDNAVACLLNAEVN